MGVSLQVAWQMNYRSLAAWAAMEIKVARSGLSFDYWDKTGTFPPTNRGTRGEVRRPEGRRDSGQTTHRGVKSSTAWSDIWGQCMLGNKQLDEVHKSYQSG